MNSCILIAEVTRAPQLRYTQDNQTAIADMEVQFSGLRPDDPPAKLKVVGWGSLAQEMQQQYQPGDQVVIEGRLGMNTVDRPEGFKEKMAELTANKIYSLGGAALAGGSGVPANVPASAMPANAMPASAMPANPVNSPTAEMEPPIGATSAKSTASKARTPKPPVVEPEADFDDIPF